MFRAALVLPEHRETPVRPAPKAFKAPQDLLERKVIPDLPGRRAIPGLPGQLVFRVMSARPAPPGRKVTLARPARPGFKATLVRRDPQVLREK